jgi:hypothetical protein
MVEHIEYNGEKHPVKLGYYTIKKLQTEHGVSLEEAMGGGIELFEPMLFYALQQGYRAEKKDCPFKIEDMEQVLDDCFFDFVQLIPKFFPEDLVKMMEVGGQTVNPKLAVRKSQNPKPKRKGG